MQTQWPRKCQAKQKVNQSIKQAGGTREWDSKREKETGGISFAQEVPSLPNSSHLSVIAASVSKGAKSPLFCAGSSDLRLVYDPEQQLVVVVGARFGAGAEVSTEHSSHGRGGEGRWRRDEGAEGVSGWGGLAVGGVTVGEGTLGKGGIGTERDGGGGCVVGIDVCCRGLPVRCPALPSRWRRDRWVSGESQRRRGRGGMGGGSTGHLRHGPSDGLLLFSPHTLPDSD